MQRLAFVNIGLTLGGSGNYQLRSYFGRLVFCSCLYVFGCYDVTTTLVGVLCQKILMIGCLLKEVLLQRRTKMLVSSLLIVKPTENCSSLFPVQFNGPTAFVLQFSARYFVSFLVSANPYTCHRRL